MNLSQSILTGNKKTLFLFIIALILTFIFITNEEFYRVKSYIYANLSENQTCTINIVMLSQNKNPFDFPHFQSTLCEISETFYYIHSGAGKNIKNKQQNKDDINITDAKIVRVDGIDSGNLFGLTLSIYYPSNYVAIFDVDKTNDKITENIIDDSINKLKRGYDIIFTNSNDPIAFISHQYVLRHFLLYTNIKYSEQSSLKILYEKCSCEKKYTYLVLNQKNEWKRSQKCSNDLPKEWFCDKDSSSKSSYAVLIPTFKRNYLSKSISSWEMQELKPTEIIVFQNRMHVTFDFIDVCKLTNIKVNHFWCTNWNSFFYLTYAAMMFIEEKYFIKTDDDYFVNETNAAKRLYNHITRNPNTMVSTHGLRNYVGSNNNTCGCTIYKKRKLIPKKADYFSLIVMMYSTSGKILHRFKIHSYRYAEDVSIGLTNALECDVKSVSIKKIKSVHFGSRDNLTHMKDVEFLSINKSKILFKETSCHYILHGYNPITWTSFSCGNNIRNLNEIRYPH